MPSSPDLPGPTKPYGGVRGFRRGRIPGCYVTEFAPHKALKLIAQGKLTFDARVVLQRVALSIQQHPYPLYYGDEEGSNLRHIDSCITQHKAQ